MTTPCSWQFTGIHLVYFSMPYSISLFQSCSSHTCPYTFSHCEHKLIYVTLQPFYFQMLLLCLDLLLALPPHNPFEKQIIFHFALAETFFSALFCPAPFHDSEFLSLPLGYKAVLDTKPRHTVQRSTRCLGSL